MLRFLLLYLSQNKTLQNLITNLNFFRRLKTRFVAGEDLEEAIQIARELNQKGILTTLNHLGEDASSEEKARRAVQEYIRILEKIQEVGLSSHVSLKLTQMGLDISENLCLENLENILKRAKNHGSFVRIDMESSQYTDRTLSIFKRLREKFHRVGVAIQANLYRSEGDIQGLLPLGVNIRLCKGAYYEPHEIAFPKKREVNRNYIQLMELFLNKEAIERGNYLAIATHDERLIEWAKIKVEERGISKEAFEFQMIYGIRRDLQEKLVQEGYRVRVYIPYGKEWYPYFMRRLAERPANLFFLLKHLFRG